MIRQLASHLVNKLAFWPPKPPSYELCRDNKTDRLFLKSHWITSNQENVDVLQLHTRCDTIIIATYVRHPTTNVTKTLIYSHGNAEDLGQIYEHLVYLSTNLHVNVMGYEYSGFGRSTGSPSEENTYADIEAVFRCLKEKYGKKREDMILYGNSIGSGPAIELASKLPQIKALILHSPILSGLRVFKPSASNFDFDIYKNIEKIGQVNCPVLVIHGTCDEVVNISHGKLLWKMCKNKFEPLWIEGGLHNNLRFYPQYITHISKFLLTLDPPTPAPSPLLPNFNKNKKRIKIIYINLYLYSTSMYPSYNNDT